MNVVNRLVTLPSSFPIIKLSFLETFTRTQPLQPFPPLQKGALHVSFLGSEFRANTVNHRITSPLLIGMKGMVADGVLAISVIRLFTLGAPYSDSLSRCHALV